MSNADRSADIDRVLIAMDSPAAIGLFPLAAELAVQLSAELQGLFVEDANLLRAAALPFAQEVCGSSATMRPLTREGIEQQLRALADQLRDSLAETARRAEVRWSFAVARGALARLAEESSRATDLLLLPQRVPAAESNAPGSAAADAARIAVLYDDSAEASRALMIAGQAARRRRTGVLVILASSDAPVETQRAEAYRYLPAQGLDIQFAAPRVSCEAELRQVVLRYPCALLLLPARNALVQGAALASLVAEIRPLVALVR